MKKLLRKLFLYLFKEDFKRMKALERDLEGLIHRQKCATSLAEVRAEEANVEIVELDKDFSPTDIPQFEDRVYTIQSRPEIPHIEWCEPVRFGKGSSKSGRSEKQIRKDRKKNKARKTHRRKK